MSLISQNGSSGDDEIRALATVADGNNTVIFAGYTDGNWTEINVGGRDFAAMRAPASYFSGTVLVPQDDEESGAPRDYSVVVGVVTVLLCFFIFGAGIWAFNSILRRADGSRNADVAVAGSRPVAHGCLVEATTAGDDAVPVVISVGQEYLRRESAAVAEGCRAPYADAVVVPPIRSVGGSGRVWNVVTDAEVVER